MAARFTRDQLGEMYLGQLQHPPYPVQEEALLAWFTCEQGVLVCAPTGTGKTLIAQAALYEALHNGTVAYYTTPLIALTEQKFYEMQTNAVRWGFPPESVGLVTGNRRVNPDAKVLVVVAEILLNRLLHRDDPVSGGEFDFANVSAVVMDEFHSFADPQRGIVWELSLSLLPPHVRLLLLSATVGNAVEFTTWLARSHKRNIDLVQGTERKVPLSYLWAGDRYLSELITDMAKGPPEQRKTPALVFCFNRDECWSIAEQLKGLPLLGDDQRSRLHEELDKLEWKTGVGPKLKQMLQRGVGVHHAGLLPKYRRAIESLYGKKLLAVALCTETLASGINLPARSVVLTSLVKGPFGKQKIIDPSTAHQIFGRAGRPQFDDRGYVYALAHEDDVKILHWKEKYDSIPEGTADPGLLKAKKALRKKRPSRREGLTYWNEQQFQGLQGAPPGKLFSKGQIPWRLLAYLLKVSPEVDRVRTVLRKRLMDDARIRAGERQLENMLLTLAAGGYVTLEPPPPAPEVPKAEGAEPATAEPAAPEKPTAPDVDLALSALLRPGLATKREKPGKTAAVEPEEPKYRAVRAVPTAKLDDVLAFRAVHPLYGAFLIEQLGIANREERIQALESVLEMPRPLLKFVRVPFEEELPKGPLATTRLDDELISRGLMLAPLVKEDDEEDDPFDDDWRNRPPTLADKLRLLFDAKFPGVTDLNTASVWCAGDVLRYGGDFNKYVGTKDLVKQEGIVFRHLLRLILLCGEFARLTPPGVEPEAWKAELKDIADKLTAACRSVDPDSTDEIIELAKAAEVDVVKGEPQADTPPPPPPASEPEEEFGIGVW